LAEYNFLPTWSLEEDSVKRRLILAGIAFLAVGLVLIWVSRDRTTQASPTHLAAGTPASSDAMTSAPVRVASPSAPNVSEASLASSSASGAAKRELQGPSAQQAIAGIPDIDTHVAFGSKTAPVVMEVFSDFQCPACKTLFMTTNRQVMENYVTTGKVYLIHRDFPLPMHAYSKLAAQYSRAAAQIGKYEPVEQALFQNQEKWEQNGDVDGTVATVLSSTEMSKVRTLVKSGTPEAAIQKDVALGRVYNVNQTPTTVFHAKGQTFPYGGGMSYDILKGFLDQLAAQ
jgi:protein-disulfide isomerase